METPEPSLVAGVDEAGRGCLAGPVAVAAVILDPSVDWQDITDSKQLSPAVRQKLAERIKVQALSYRVTLIGRRIIDRVNILQATFRGMQRVVRELSIRPHLVLVDGNRAPPMKVPCQTIVNGDAREKCIGAASILAKTTRDAYMVNLDLEFPQYGFARHKGYGTAQHLAALRTHGPIREHRRSFAPVRGTLQGELFEPDLNVPAGTVKIGR